MGLLIKNGTRFQMAFDYDNDSNPEFNMICTYAKSIDDSAFLVSIPMVDGKKIEPNENIKLLFAYDQGEEKAIIAGYVDDVVKVGIRSYWKIRRVSEQRKFFERKDERYNITLRMQYYQETWNPDMDGNIPKEDALTMNISAGGMATYLNRNLQVGEVCDITLPRLGTEPAGHKLEGLIGVVCWLREAPRGSMFRRLCGLQFRFSDEVDRARFLEYLEYMRKKYKL